MTEVARPQQVAETAPTAQGSGAEIGAFVWAKVPGFQPAPARIISQEEFHAATGRKIPTRNRNEQLAVRLYGDNRPYATLPRSPMAPWRLPMITILMAIQPRLRSRLQPIFAMGACSMNEAAGSISPCKGRLTALGQGFE